MANHDCRVGIIRIPGLGWPVNCRTCGRVGYGKTQEEGRTLARNHTKSKKSKKKKK